MRSSFPRICKSFLFVITIVTTGCEDKVASTEQGVRNVVVERTMDTPFSWPILPWQTPLPSPVKREVVVRPDKSVYRADRDLQGGYYVQSVTNDDVRELIISFSDESFEPAPNNPDATTIPGFYPSPGVRFDFEKIEVVKKKVYFKTRKIKGVSFLFRGTATKIKNQDFYGIPIFYITGFLERKENERITRKEKVTFQHMVNM